jgi:hypothetical protein
MTASTRWFVVVALSALLGAAGLHFLVLAGAGRLWPAATHLTIFGWVTAMILAVSYHTMPAFSARDFPYPGLVALHCGVFLAGITLATAGLAVSSAPVIVAGLLLEAIASLVFVANTLLLFLRGSRRPRAHPIPPHPHQRDIDRIGTRATKIASLCLPLALLILAAVYQGTLGAGWLLAAEHLAVLGWVMLMIVGVAVHVLPRFSGHALRGRGWARVQLACHCAGLGLIVLALGSGWAMLFALGGILMALALGMFAATVWPTLAVVRPRPTTVPIVLQERSR